MKNVRAGLKPMHRTACLMVNIQQRVSSGFSMSGKVTRPVAFQSEFRHHGQALSYRISCSRDKKKKKKKKKKKRKKEIQGKK